MIPTQAQIDQSELFQERPSDKTAPVADVSDAWMSILEKLWLTMEAPDKMKPKDGTAPLYKFKDLMRLVPNPAGAWTAKCAKPALVAVIPPTTTTPLEPVIGMEGLHNVAALCKVAIPKLSGDPEKKAKQFSFCGYCGVRIENFEMDVNHIRHHLRLELLCGGCNGKAFITNIQMSSHLKKCEAVLNVLGQLGGQQQVRGLPEQEEIAPHLGTPTIPRPASGSIHLCITTPSTALSGLSFYSERLCPSHPNYGVRAS